MIIYGENSYLIKHIKKYLDKNTTYFFASPIDTKNFKNIVRTFTSNILLVKALLHKNKIVYASSIAVSDKSLYGLNKRFCEFLIKKFSKKYLILRIPRVYSQDRNKGLIKNIKDNRIPYSDLSNLVEFIDINDFIKWFRNNKHKNGILSYDLPKYKLTISNIKKLYCL